MLTVMSPLPRDHQGSALLSALCGSSSSSPEDSHEGPVGGFGSSNRDSTTHLQSASAAAAAAAAAEDGGRDYLATSAASALLQYVSAELGVTVAPGALGLERLSLHSHMRIDPSTAAALELVKSQRPLPGTALHCSRLLHGTCASIDSRLVVVSSLRLLYASDDMRGDVLPLHGGDCDCDCDDDGGGGDGGGDGDYNYDYDYDDYDGGNDNDDGDDNDDDDDDDDDCE